MKKLISTIVIAFLFGMVQIAFAVPAAPIIHTLEQPDGTKFQAKMWGDEWQHGWETVDGYSIVYDKTSQTWSYAVADDSGMLAPSERVVEKDLPPTNSPINLRPVEKTQSKILDAKISRAAPAPNPPQKVVPPTGSANIPIILINFNNTATTYTTGNFNTLLFGNGTNSMKDYYEEVSQGAFSISPGPSGVTGGYTAANSHDYYGENWGGQGDDMWPGDLVYEAVVAADAAVDFSAYDSDGDCYVDVVGIVHQGTGEEVGGPTTDIWSHRWNLFAAWVNVYSHYGPYTTGDVSGSCPGGYIVNDYIIMPELYNSTTISTIGVFAHEYGHAFGLPDLYDTNSSNGASEGIGNWGLMGSGNWLGTLPGSSPAHMSAWSKYFLGWVSPTKVTTSLFNEQINRSETYDDVYMLLDNPGDSPGNLDWDRYGTGTGEYFLIENRYKTGFDAYLPGEGLLIWHIDESRENNGDETRYLVALEQADGSFDLEDSTNNRGDVNDPWVSSATGFTEATTPNTALYNGSSTRVRVTDISASAAVMTANFIVDWPPPVVTLVDPTPQNNSNLNRNYVFVNVTTSESLSTALLEWNGVNESMSSGSWYKNKTGLVDGTYTFKVWGRDLGGNWNVTETRVVNIDTTAPTITIHSPMNKTMTDNTPLLNVTFGEAVNTTWYNDGTADSAYYYGVSNLTLNLTTFEDGLHNIKVYANDSFGNLDYSRVYFTVDAQPPKITVSSPQNITYNSTTLYLNVSANKVIDTWTYNLNSGENQTFIPNTTITAINGMNNLTVYANDTSGNLNSSTVYFTIPRRVHNDTGYNFSTIQEAIDGSIDGATITVDTVTLTENVDVNKSVNLIGAGVGLTIVQGADPNDPVFNVTANGVNISGFTVTGATSPFYGGIYLNQVNYTSISNNSISNNYNGIYLDNSSGNTITNNTFSSNGWDFNSTSSSSSTMVTNLFNDARVSFTYSGDIRVNSSSSPAGDPIGYQNISKYLNIVNTTVAWVYLNISYVNADLGAVNESTLRMYRYNAAWSDISGTNGVDTSNNYVYANLTTFSVFAPMGRDAILPDIIIGSPQNSTKYNTFDIDFNITVSEPVDANTGVLIYYIDGNTGSVSIPLVNDSLTHWYNDTVNLADYNMSDGQYNATFKVTDFANNSNTSTVWFTIDSTAPNITSVSSGSITTSSATITWTTDEAANSTVYYGTTAPPTTPESNSSFVTSHSITLSVLSAGTTYYYNVSSCDVTGNCNTSQQYSFTTTSSGSPSGGGGGGGGAATSFEVRIMDVQAGQTVDQDIDDDDVLYLRGISLTLKHDTYSSRFSVTDLKKKPWSSMADPDASVYRYFKAKYDKKSYVESAVFEFRVPKSWLNESDISLDTIRMYRYTTEWNELVTEFMEEDDEWAYFKSETPGFSYFSIGGAEGSGYLPVVAVVEEVAVKASMLAEPVKVQVQKTPAPTPTSPPATDPPTEEKKGICGPTAIVLLAMIPLLFSRRMRPG